MTEIGHETLGSWSFDRPSSRTGLLWALSLTAVLTAQLGIFLALSRVEAPPPSAGSDLPTTVLELELDPTPVEAQAAPAEAVDTLLPDDTPPDPVTPTAAEAVPPDSASPLPPQTDPVRPDTEALQPTEVDAAVPVEAADPVTPEATEAEATGAADAAETADAVEAAIVPQASPEAAETLDSPQAELVLPQAPNTASAEAIDSVPVQAETLSPLAPKPKAKPQAPKSEKQTSTTTKSRKATTATPQQRTRSALAPLGSRQTASGSEVSSWTARLKAKLNDAHQFPRAARRRHEFGSVLVRLSLDNNGGVQSAIVVKSSGYATLDEAALNAVRRAEPLPAPPSGTPQNKLTMMFSYNFTESTPD